LKKLFCSLILLAASSAALSQVPAPYVLENTEVHNLSANELQREKTYAARHKDLKAKVYFGIGGLEVKSADGEDDMVADLKEFETALNSQRYPSLQITSKVFADEDHLSVGPMIMTRGLKWALPPRR